MSDLDLHESALANEVVGLRARVERLRGALAAIAAGTKSERLPTYWEWCDAHLRAYGMGPVAIARTALKEDDES